MKDPNVEFVREMFKTHGAAWISRGLFFGYPACCIANFCFERKMATPEVVDRFGFCPCPECAKKDPEVVIKEVMAKRSTRLTSDEIDTMPWSKLRRKLTRFSYRLQKRRPGSRHQDFNEVTWLIAAAQKRAKKQEEKAARKAQQTVAAD